MILQGSLFLQQFAHLVADFISSQLFKNLYKKKDSVFFYTLDAMSYKFDESSLFKNEYFAAFLAICISFFLAFIIIWLSLLFVTQKPDAEKLSTYECGFEPYNDARHKFDIKFYLLAIIFIVFDIETAFLLPLTVSLSKLGTLGFWSMIDFIFELNFVYLYIWSIGALEWD